jgi:glc operon protein GlcG
MRTRSLILAAALVTSTAAFAQAPATPPPIPQYGPNITHEQAKKVLAAAEADTRTRGWPMAIAIVDTAGMLVAFTKFDNTQSGSVQISQDKAISSAMLRRPTKAIQDAVAGGGAGIRFLGLRYATPVEGGLPLVIGGKIVGAIGVSGMASDQDGVIAKTGADALAAP